ncbi:MAG: helix-hairpin-helix domain-containing protein [Bacteroidales bacterium]|nr:helix-hairpin-helix domain-containing protein [Bacteroidales bacterium]MBN2817922.1 helix-hairpin-helix domain-containing protein [Bacteroidales bacterium]
MKSIRNKIEPYFSFTASEKRALVVLFSLIFILIILRLVLPLRKSDEVSFEFYSIEDRSDFKPEGTKPAIAQFPNESFTNPEEIISPIDPNTASFNQFIEVGFSKFAASNIIKYRESGGFFKSKAELSKIYGVDTNNKFIIDNFIKIDSTLVTEKNFVTNPVNKISINRADSLALVKVPGIGPAFSSRILKYRRLLGGFYSFDQLKEVYGLPESIIKNAISYFDIDTSAIKQINLNKADFNELVSHPYISSYQAKAILKYRQVTGNISELEELIKSNLVTTDELQRLRPYFCLF